jgi:hypothetical protein
MGFSISKVFKKAKRHLNPKTAFKDMKKDVKSAGKKASAWAKRLPKQIAENPLASKAIAVVGAVAAPWTGGASLALAKGITTSAGVYHAKRQMDKAEKAQERQIRRVKQIQAQREQQAIEQLATEAVQMEIRQMNEESKGGKIISADELAGRTKRAIYNATGIEIPGERMLEIASNAIQAYTPDAHKAAVLKTGAEAMYNVEAPSGFLGTSKEDEDWKKHLPYILLGGAALLLIMKAKK